MPRLPEALRKAVKEYYEWQGDKSGHAVKIVQNHNKGAYKMVLARLTDAEGDKLSSLMDYQPWADGHYDVTEIFVGKRECEDQIVQAFVESDEYL